MERSKITDKKLAFLGGLIVIGLSATIIFLFGLVWFIIGIVIGFFTLVGIFELITLITPLPKHKK